VEAVIDLLSIHLPPHTDPDVREWLLAADTEDVARIYTSAKPRPLGA